jgi:hypothetical protein
MRPRLTELALTVKYDPEIPVGLGKVRFDFDRPVIRGHGFIEFALSLQCRSKIGIGVSETRVDADRLAIWATASSNLPPLQNTLPRLQK